MPTYHIELRTAQRVWDTIVVEQPDVTSLRSEVARFVGELLHEHAEQLWLDEEWRVDVTDHKGLIMFVLHLFVTESTALAAPRR